MRVVVAGRQGFRVQPEDRAELGAVDAGVADESKQFGTFPEQRGPGFAASAPVALVISTATCRAAGARLSMSWQAPGPCRQHEADQLLRPPP
jgi:hypothetical protein